MSDETPPPSLEELDARLRKAREGTIAAETARRNEPLPPSPLGLALRIGIELVTAIAVGAGGGYLLDQWLGTAPWGMIVMFFLGAGAGMNNVYRAMKGLGYATGYGREQNDQDRPNGGDRH